MILKLTEREVYSYAFNRNLSDNLIKQHQIDASFISWIADYLPEQFISDIYSSEGDDYDEFVEDYIKPIWSFGVLHDNFDYISLNITDKGVIQLLVEGTANLIGRDSRMDIKFEVRNTIYQLLKLLDRYATYQKKEENELFNNYTGLKMQPSMVKFVGKPRMNKIPY